MELSYEDNVEKIENIFVDDFFKHYLLSRKPLNGFDYHRLDVTIAQLLRTDIKCVIPLNEDETYAIRKRLGILDNGEPQSIVSFRDHQFKIHRDADDHFYRGNIKLFDRIITDGKESNFNRISPLDLNPLIPNFDACSLDLDSKADSALLNHNIRTVRDVLSFSTAEYETIGLSQKQINSIKRCVHKYGLKLIDELNLDETKKIIMRTNTDNLDVSGVSLSGYEKESKTKVKVKKK